MGSLLRLAEYCCIALAIVMTCLSAAAIPTTAYADDPFSDTRVACFASCSNCGGANQTVNKTGIWCGPTIVCPYDCTCSCVMQLTGHWFCACPDV